MTVRLLSIVLGTLAVAANLSGQTTTASNAVPELISVKKIASSPQHEAFTDLIQFNGKWFCTFRKSKAHVGGDGKIPVLVSDDGEKWKTAAELTEQGIDLRDPKFSITPDNRLMLVMGGSLYEETTLKERQPRVAF